MSRLAIDLGTTNSQIATLNEAGEPSLFEVDGSASVPSIAYVEPEGGQIAVGALARDYWSDPQYEVHRSFRRWKLRMGDAGVLRSLALGAGGARLDVTPLLLTQTLVRHLVRQVTEGIGGAQAEGVVATVPHGWRRLRPESCAATLEAMRTGLEGLGPRAEEATLSEPVAAAAFWIWAAGRSGSGSALRGGHVLVCDMGGGTFDLSLIRVGDDLASLDVVDAVNSDHAGDFADALLCVHLARKAGGAPAVLGSAERVLASLDDPAAPWLRGWFREATRVKESQSRAAETIAARAGRPRRIAANTLQLPDPGGGGGTLPLSLTFDELKEALEPFFQRGRDLVGSFLARLPRGTELSGVAFAGGGSKIAGVREEIVARQLRESLGRDVEPVMSRLVCNPAEIDKAVVKGAALIANGVVQITERLLHDVGLVVTLTEETARRAGLGAQRDVLVTPLLRRGTRVPAVFEEDLQTSLGIFFEGGHPKAELRVVVDDASGEARELGWEAENPARGSSLDVAVALRVDGNGELTLAIRPKKGDARPLELTAPLGREDRAANAEGRPALRRMSPEEFRELLAGTGRTKR